MWRKRNHIVRVQWFRNGRAIKKDTWKCHRSFLMQNIHPACCHMQTTHTRRISNSKQNRTSSQMTRTHVATKVSRKQRETYVHALMISACRPRMAAGEINAIDSNEWVLVHKLPRTTSRTRKAQFVVLCKCETDYHEHLWTIGHLTRRFGSAEPHDDGRWSGETEAVNLCWFTKYWLYSEVVVTPHKRLLSIPRPWVREN